MACSMHLMPRVLTLLTILQNYRWKLRQELCTWYMKYGTIYSLYEENYLESSIYCIVRIAVQSINVSYPQQYCTLGWVSQLVSTVHDFKPLKHYFYST